MYGSGEDPKLKLAELINLLIFKYRVYLVVLDGLGVQGVGRFGRSAQYS